MLTLRDIFLDLADIFGFSYEKNQNGSYRVNTVIRSLVYPELYTEKEHGENDIAYYLANPEYSYQAFPNIRNSFSELMSPKDNSNRFPVIFFCNEIEIPSMYRYYKMKIAALKVQAGEQTQKLRAFLNRIFEQDPTFQAKLNLSCEQDYEFLTWIILFSMFKEDLINEKYERYLQTLSEQLADLSISESGARHKLSASLIARKVKLDYRKNMMYGLCAIEIFLAFLPFIIPDNHRLHSLFMGSSFCLTLLVLTFLLLLLRIKQAKSEHAYSDLQTYHDYMSEIPDEELEAQLQADNTEVSIVPWRNMSHSNVSRNNFRRNITILLYVLLAVSLVVSLWLQSFPILATWVSLCVLVFIYADRIFNDYTSRTFYDKKTLQDGEKARPWRGLAKIYQTEYQKTKFNLKDKYYDTVVHVHSGSCYQHIFLIAYDRLNYNVYVYNSVLVYCTAVFLLLEILMVFLGDTIIEYLRLPDAATFNIIVSMYILAIGLYTLTTSMISAQNNEYRSKLAFASRHAEKHPEWAEKLFLNLYARGIIRDIDWMRGVFTYNMACFEDGKFVEDIFPESDRMMYYHRHVTFRPVAKITISLSYMAIISLVVWHFQVYYLFLPITVFCILLYIYMHRIGLKRLNQKTILREIKKLSREKDSSVSNK